MSDFITTFSKNKFSPVNPEKESILIEDIAHALSLMTRANGHLPEFYSVAQHCIACSKEALARNYSDRVILACLLHDASEAYLSDITRPVKKELEMYINIEKKLQDMIYTVFLGSKLDEHEFELVNAIDNSMLYNEFLHYMNEKLDINPERLLSNPDFKVVDFKEIEDEYKKIFYIIHDKIYTRGR